MAVASNPKAWGISLMLVVVLATLWATDVGKTTQVDDVKEYVLTVGGEELRFTTRPELGYVLKVYEDAASLEALSGMLKYDSAADISLIGGSGRKGMSVVYSERPADENLKTVKLLATDKQVRYAAPLFSSNGETVAIIPEIVVRVKPGTGLGQLLALCEKSGCRINKRMEFTEHEYLLEVLGPDAEAVFAAVGRLGQAPCVEWACPNTASQPKLLGQPLSGADPFAEQLRIAAAAEDANSPGVFPNDEYFPNQWHLRNTGQSGGTPGADIRAPEAWEITTGDPNIIVAVPDTGVDSNHPDLVNNTVAGYDFVDDDNHADPSLDHPENAHGTACAGLIAAQGNNGIGVTGVTWNCKIMPVRNGGVRSDATEYMVTEADMATAFRWAAAQGGDILSNSWGLGTAPTPIIYSGIVDVTRAGGIGRDGKGCVVLFGAGNDNGALPYPSKYPEVIAVGATDPNDVRYNYSNFGPDLDIVTPSGYWGGDRIIVPQWTTDIAGPIGYNVDNTDTSIFDYMDAMGGTSGACPIAAGVAALILSVEPNLTSDEVRYFLERSAKDLGTPGRDDYYGWGRVDARAALDMVLAKRADLNDDWKVDLEDLLILIEFWGTAEPSADIAPATRRNGIVDENDLELLMRYWGQEIPEPGLVARWKLDETEASVAQNSVSDNDAVLHGEPQWQPEGGQMGGALQFDGVDDYVSTAKVLDPSTGPFSVFAWVKGGAPGQVFVSQVKGANWLMAGAPDGGLATELKTSRPTVKGLKSATSVTDGAWHRVGFVWDSPNRILYVDAIEVARDTHSSLAASAGGLYIGAGKALETGTFFSGLIDDVRIYNRAVRP